jgi:hypothetical protein
VTLDIQIEAINVAFDGENRGHELARILREIAGQIEQNGDCDSFYMSLRDWNGNRVGVATLARD